MPIPPPSHLAVLNTLIVHPIYTTRAEKPDQREVSTRALAYLRDVLKTVGPVDANFRTAFQFRASERWNRRSTYSGYNTDSEMSDGDSEAHEDRIRGRMADESSVWRRGRDFWSTVGWAFNCSSLYPDRWKYWRAWLEFMFDVLEADWQERTRQDLETHESTGGEGDAPTTAREDAMILAYMNQQNGSHGGFKNIIKAILADGGSLSTSAFQEVFDKEPRGPRKEESRKRKRHEELDLENDKFGDYFEEEGLSSSISEPPTPERPRERRGASFGIAYSGLAESVDLRMRLFCLVSEATYTTRKRTEINKLYEALGAGLKVAPLEFFNLFVSQRTSPLELEMQVTLFKELFHLLLPATHKNPHKIDPDGEATGNLTTAMMEHCYMPYPANTISIEDNAKLSLVVESSLQMLWANDMLDYSKDFAVSAEKGIEARLTKCKKKRTGKAKADADEVIAQDSLRHSGDRIQLMLEMIKA